MIDYGGRVLRLKQTGGRAPLLGQTWEVAAWEFAHLGSFHLGKYSWEVAARGKMPLG